MSKADTFRNRFTAEERLLLACALPPEQHQPETIVSLTEDISDWQKFTEQAIQAKFAPLAFTRLMEAGLKSSIPRPLFIRLAAAQVAADGLSRRLLAERDRILEVFKEEKLSALPLKGCALADTLYGDPSLRPMGDLDLLLKEEEFDRAVRLLLKLGYRTDGIDPRGETFFYEPDHHLFIDAHTSLDPSGRFRILSSDLWECAAPLPIQPFSTATSDACIKGEEEETTWQTLSVQHHFVHALLHAARHRLDSMGPLVDAAWMAARWPDAIQWESIPSLAHRWRCKEALGFALEAAEILFSLPVPDSVRKQLLLRGWRQHAMSRVWPGESALQSLEARPQWVRYSFSAITTSWPWGFVGATRRFKSIRPVKEHEFP